MTQSIRPLVCVAVAVVACLVLATPVAHAQSVLGEWKLVEQTYGDGKSNLVAPSAPGVRLELFREGTRIQGRISGGGRGAADMSWPRLVADDSRAIHVEEKRLSTPEDQVLVRYRVDPSPGDDLILEVTEEYRVVDDGRALVGTVRVEFRRDGKERGSYVLHRRFERTSR